MPPSADPDAFIARWEGSGASERANYQLFLSELCDLLGVPRPDPAKANAAGNAYTFERAVTRIAPDGTETTAFIDLYRASCFVLETKQGVTAAAQPASNALLLDETAPYKTGHGVRGSKTWDKALERAYHQARRYIRDLPAPEGRPPFLIVCDVGHVIELYAEFSRTGGAYVRFPGPATHRILLQDLRDPAIRQLLRAVWLDPLSLDPSRRAAKVTREIAAHLARLAQSLEVQGHDPEAVALFLQRCLFTLFAEDIGLLPKAGFLDMLREIKDKPGGFTVMAEGLWKEMRDGAKFSMVLKTGIPQFNGGLFDNPAALPLDAAQIQLLLNAATADWAEVEPAIFGTLLERALNPRERHKLGAHYTPRSYVERLVQPTIIEPLREEWDAARAAAAQHHARGADKKAQAEVEAFHRRLCAVRVLDPACGSGNFLYVTLEHMKRLEAEVLDLYETLGGPRTFEMEQFKVRPGQFFGLEINQHAVAIAQLVLWIGYFQWQHRATGKADTNDRPLLEKRNTIRHQDAVLAFDAKTPCPGPGGRPLAVWDGHTTKQHPVTGREVPDETATKVVFDYKNPRRAEWPEADFVVGNPPFIGTKRMIDALGDGYTEALRWAWSGDVPESADFVMFWWQKAAELLRAGKIRRFGFITTNSIHQTFNRRVLEPHLSETKHPVHIDFAIPDHPWVDSADGAAVRIAMTVAAPGEGAGILASVIDEREIADGEHEVEISTAFGAIGSNLRIGADLVSVGPLKSNALIAGMGVALHGSGFILEPGEAHALMATGSQVIRVYVGGMDLLRRRRERYLIDFSFMTEKDAAAANPAAFQHVLTHVKPERDQNRRAVLKRLWWRFGWERPILRRALNGLSRYIGTTETAKHRVFQFIDGRILADHMVVCIATADAWHLGVLSSSVHVAWALGTGGTLEDRPRYNKTVCFEPFPFPDPSEPVRRRIRDLGERLDAHRKARQAADPELTLTGMYNVLEKLRAGAPLDDKDKAIHESGLVSVLKQIHDDLDDAVLEAYGWPDLHPLQDPDPARRQAKETDLLGRLVALNHQRADEEAKGIVRYLRPEFQNPAGAPAKALQTELDTGSGGPSKPAKTVKHPWPNDLPGQVRLVKSLLPQTGARVEALAAALIGGSTINRRKQLEDILQTLENLGHI